MTRGDNRLSHTLQLPSWLNASHCRCPQLQMGVMVPTCWMVVKTDISVGKTVRYIGIIYCWFLSGDGEKADWIVIWLFSNSWQTLVRL